MNCGQTGCKALAKWDTYRLTDRDGMLLTGTYCERHALMMNGDRNAYLRPTPALADMAYTRERERAVRLAR